ncbi:MAG: nucleotidyltransferase domain-containing protein [Saprospiraceae bacterium]|nr:nucleotidyltransferase domain-containing protein [Saprospiraceae bacterium]MDW8230170.1 nucleotidyltransferase domain-containing protein [Saprospiraceae bacterium]
MKLPVVLEQRMASLRVLCQKHGVARLYVCGSAVSGAFEEDTSDLDFQVELLPTNDAVTKGLALPALWDDLEQLYGRKVDLLTDQPIVNPILRGKVEETKVLLYEWCCSPSIVLPC